MKILPILAYLTLPLAISDAPAAEANGAAAGPGSLQPAGHVQRDDLRAVVRVVFSPDARFLYAAAWQASAIATFRRDSASGALEHVETISNPRELAGVTGLDISPDGHLAAAAAFKSGTLCLFKRDPETGKLERLQVIRQTDPGVDGLGFAVRAEFAPDGHHLYAADGGMGGVTTFAVTNQELRWLETNLGTDNCLAGTRGLALSSDGRRIYTSNYRAHTLAALRRDPKTGRTTVEQVVRDEEGGAHGLGGAFGAACSPDDKFIYVVAGRFGGDDAVSAYAVQPDGSLAVLQEFTNANGDLAGFRGGNSITVSPDGRFVCASATVSGSLAVFERHAVTGKLRLVEILQHNPDKAPLDGAAGMACSPDGRFVYVAAEFANSISIFEVQ